MPLEVDLSKHASSHMHEYIHECTQAHSHAYLSMRVFPLVPCHAGKVWLQHIHLNPHGTIACIVHWVRFLLGLCFGLCFLVCLLLCKQAPKSVSHRPMAMLQRALAEHLQIPVSTSYTRQAKSQTVTLLQCCYLPQHVCQHPKWLREPFRQRSLDERHIC